MLYYHYLHIFYHCRVVGASEVRPFHVNSIEISMAYAVGKLHFYEIDVLLIFP